MDITLTPQAGTIAASSDAKDVNSLSNQATQAEPVAADAVTATQEAQKQDDVELQERVEKATQGLNEFFSSIQKNIQFSIDEDTDRSVVKVLEASSGEVIRQIPAESVLELAAKMSKASGLLVEEMI
ncbi:flagellar protein FlaG [Ferrimonas aestuarii]|nr:flagellar protein FlaG [Ferrimonas aestuarii]